MRGDQTAVRRLMGSLSLDALRGFEASARRSSFTAAAEELFLTQSAVSKQVKLLEVIEAVVSDDDDAEDAPDS